MGSRAIIGLLVWLTGISTAYADTHGFVLTPGAEGQVRRMLQVDRPLRGGRLPLEVTIDKDRIVVTAGPVDKPTVAVTLTHPESGGGEVVAGAELMIQSTPGPAPSWAIKELKRRIVSAGKPLVWRSPTKEVGSAPAEALEKTIKEPLWTVDSIRTALNGAAHRISTGELEAARAVLGELPSGLDTEASLEVAVLWHLTGDKERARELLDGAGKLEAPLSIAAAVIRGDKSTAADALKALESEKACGHMVVAALHERLGNRTDVVTTAARIRELDPECREAWEMEVHGLVYEDRIPQALELGDEALKRFPDDVRMLRAVASVHHAKGDLAGAIPLLERAARAQPDEPGILRVLLGAIVRDQEVRAAHRVTLEERVRGGGADAVDRFLLGVIRHYANEFEASNQLLRPLESKLDHEDRLHIYIAMNDFNLERVGDALVRLDRASRRTAPDPDIYYCLAEILRDTDRHRALKELRRYANLSQGDVLSNPSKEVRIQGLVAGLEACLKDGRARCEGEWEHPRLRERQEEEELQRSLVWAGGALLLASVVYGLLARLRRRTREA